MWPKWIGEGAEPFFGLAGHYSGEGVGKLLVVTLAEYARANSRKVIPLCSFARAVFDKMLGIRDVLVR